MPTTTCSDRPSARPYWTSSSFRRRALPSGGRHLDTGGGGDRRDGVAENRREKPARDFVEWDALRSALFRCRSTQKKRFPETTSPKDPAAAIAIKKVIVKPIYRIITHKGVTLAWKRHGLLVRGFWLPAVSKWNRVPVSGFIKFSSNVVNTFGATSSAHYAHSLYCTSSLNVRREESS